MSLAIIGASIVTGVIAGWWLCLVVASAAMSRSQQHMQERVRYWQDRAFAARAETGPPDIESVMPDSQSAA